MAHKVLAAIASAILSLSATANAQVSFSVNDVSANEGDDLVFTITKTGSDGQSHDVDYDTNNGTATNSDYDGESGTLTFTNSETTKIVTVSTDEDYDDEDDETIILELDDATGGATISDDEGVGTILNDDGLDAPVQFTINDVSVTEGGDLVFTVTKTGDDGLTHEIDYDAKNGTATASDYEDSQGTLTFTSSQYSQTVTVETEDDTNEEDDETVELELDNVTNGANIADDIGVGTILDNDSSETPPTFSINDVSVTEGGNLVFTVTKTGTVSQSYSVDFATANGTATAGSDYTAQSNTLTFTSSDSTKQITVATTDDSSIESAETVQVNLSNASGGSSITDSQGIGTINDNDQETPPSFSINDPNVTEGGNLVFTVTKTGTVAQSYSVDFATANGTATAGSDYTAQSNTLTFTSSDTTKQITVLTIDDSTVEMVETVLVNLSNATGGATISDAQGEGGISDNDGGGGAITFEYDVFGRLKQTDYTENASAAYTYDALGNRTAVTLSGFAAVVSFSIDDVTVTEGAAAQFTVTKTGTATQSIDIDYATSNGTATAGSDYTAASNTLTFGVSDTTKTFSVSTTDDGTQEIAETFTVTLSNATGGAQIGDGQGQGTINDNDQETPPSFLINDVSATEGGNLVFTVTKTGSVTQSYSVDFATANGTATAGSDYTAQNNTLTFTSSDSTKQITVLTTDDSSQESAETVQVNLSNASGGASITDALGIGTINDNDGSTSVSFSINDVSANEGDDLVFTITKTGNDGQSHDVEYDTNNGTATNSDYDGVSGTLTFTSSETAKTVTVSTDEDYNDEDDETVLLELDNATGGATISDDQGVGTILNDDGLDAPVQFTVNDVSVTEGGNLVFTVTKTGDDGLTHAVDYDSKNGTATGSDYEDTNGTLTFTSAQTSHTVSVPTESDTNAESDETVELELDNATNGANIQDNIGVGTILDDD